MNIILDDKQRETYKDVIAELALHCPETIKRKFERANVQQAFVFDLVRKLSGSRHGRILSVGAYEDTASEALRKIGYNVIEIDPIINMSLEDFVKKHPGEKFEIVMSTSVIEHVQDDELFIAQICGVLKDDGYAVLTCDFKDSYRAGDSKPGEDYRLYTKTDLVVRLNDVLSKNGCRIYGKIDYEGTPDFQYGVYKYSFATFCFRRGEK